MPPDRSCQATNADGDPCGAPSNVVDHSTGFCPAHGPNGREQVREAARRGGEATARKRKAPGMETDHRFTLDTFEDAKNWLYLITRAVLSGKVTHQQARAAVKAIEAWMDAHDRGQVAEELDELGDALAQWRETGDPTPVLELVK